MLAAQSLSTRFIPNERTYEHCKNLYEGTMMSRATNNRIKNKLETRVKLGHQTWLCSDPCTGSFFIQYWATPIVIFREDGSVILDSGTWKTRSTISRMNDFSPYNVSSNKGIWKVKVHDELFGFQDGMRIEKDGKVYGDSLISDREIEILKKKIKRYIKNFCDAITSGKIEQKRSCLLCAGIFGKDSEHIHSHIKERYYPYDLLENAIKDFSKECMCPLTSDFFYRIWTEKKPISEISDWQKDLVIRDCKKMLRKFLYREFNIGC